MARSYPDEFCVCFRCFTGDRPTAATRASSYSYVWLRAFTIHTWATHCRCLCVTQIGKHWNAQLITVNADHEFCVADECRHRQNEHDEDIKHKSWPSVWQMAKAHPKRSWTFFFCFKYIFEWDYNICGCVVGKIANVQTRISLCWFDGLSSINHWLNMRILFCTDCICLNISIYGPSTMKLVFSIKMICVDAQKWILRLINNLSDVSVPVEAEQTKLLHTAHCPSFEWH